MIPFSLLLSQPSPLNISWTSSTSTLLSGAFNALIGTDITYDNNHVYCLLYDATSINSDTPSYVYKFDNTATLVSTFSFGTSSQSFQYMPDGFFYSTRGNDGSGSLKFNRISSTGSVTNIITVNQAPGVDYFNRRIGYSPYNNRIYTARVFNGSPTNETYIVSASGSSASLIETRDYLTATNDHTGDYVAVGSNLYIGSFRSAGSTYVSKVDLTTNSVISYTQSQSISLNYGDPNTLQMAYDGSDSIAVSTYNTSIASGTGSMLGLFTISTGNFVFKSATPTPYHYIMGITYNTSNGYYYLFSRESNVGKLYKTQDLINHTLVTTFSPVIYNNTLQIRYIPLTNSICLTYNELVNNQILKVIKFIEP